MQILLRIRKSKGITPCMSYFWSKINTWLLQINLRNGESQFPRLTKGMSKWKVRAPYIVKSPFCFWSNLIVCWLYLIYLHSFLFQISEKYTISCLPWLTNKYHNQESYQFLFPLLQNTTAGTAHSHPNLSTFLLLLLRAFCLICAPKPFLHMKFLPRQQ